MTEPNRQSGENEERIIEIEIERLRPFKEHPFQVKDDKEMFLLQESIEKYGILNPLIVRPVPDGYYEIISGHRRKHAAEKLGYRKVPVIIRVLSEDDSILSMVDSNLHRERISYSEKAFAYKLKNDVLKRKSGRKKSQVDHKTPRKRAIEIISEDCGDSPKQVHPFNDGNGRMSRLLTLLLFYKAGYIVGKYVSMEMLIEKTKETYYEALQASSTGWHEGENSYEPFVKYYLGIMLKAYNEFESRVEHLKHRSLSKPDRIKAVIDNKVGKITKKEIMELCPDISKITVERTLTNLVKSGYIAKVGAGPSTGYVRV